MMIIMQNISYRYEKRKLLLLPEVVVSLNIQKKKNSFC